MCIRDRNITIYFSLPCARRFSRIDLNTLCKITKKQRSNAITILVHQDDNVPWNVMIVSMIPLISDPNSDPTTVPTPPVKSVPPITCLLYTSYLVRDR